jgi:hypothetical protein
VKLLASIVSSALVAGRAQDISFALALTNDGPSAAVVCAKDAPVAPLYELPRWIVGLAPAGDGGPGTHGSGTIPVARLFDPRLGAPAPPYLPRYLKEHGVSLKAGATLAVRVDGCWLPRAALPDDARLRRLLNHPIDPPAPLPAGARWNMGDYARASLLVLGESCATVTRALARAGDDGLFGMALAVIPEPGSRTISFTYDEQEAYGFIPRQPIPTSAPALRFDVP